MVDLHHLWVRLTSRPYGWLLALQGWWANRFPCPECGAAHKRHPWYVPRWDEDKVAERLGFRHEGQCDYCGRPLPPVDITEEAQPPKVAGADSKAPMTERP